MEFLFILLIILSLGGWSFYKDRKKFNSNGIDFNNCITTLKWKADNDNSVILKTPSLDMSRINSYSNPYQKKFEFRPQTFDQFIGQKEAKARAETIIKKARTGMKAHLIVDGVQGGGKTSYIEILARTIPAKLISRIGRQVDEEEIVNIINEINGAKEDFIILFLDEIDTIKPKILKIFNPIVESFKIGDKGVRPFVFACATINKYKLIKSNPDFLDRLPHHIKFERYNAEEIKQIITQYKEQLYADKKVSEDVQDIISKNCKFNPRISISLLEDFITEQNIEKVMHNSKIVKDGLTTTDIDILRVLSVAKKPMGANNLATKVKLSEQQYLTEFEPYLVGYDYINRVPSRMITDKGREVLNEIKQKN